MGNGTTTARAQIDAVLALAKEALAEVERDLESLTERQAQLYEFIRLGGALLQGEALCHTRSQVPLAPVPQTAARQAENILREVGHPMRVEEIYRCLEARGMLKGRQPKEALKSALRHHTRVFRRVGRGVYGLVAWNTSPVAVGQ
jgi:HB1, ASXL, restriction endonuclease HTH domain